MPGQAYGIWGRLRLKGPKPLLKDGDELSLREPSPGQRDGDGLGLRRAKT